MWFAKWFGGRSDEHEDDEPARFPPSAARLDPRPARHTASPPENKAKPSAQTLNAKKGFDPYNSGAFERKNAWERTNRR
jgi:hypothetical protein